MDYDFLDEVVELYRTDAPHSGNCRGHQSGGPDAIAAAVDLPGGCDVAQEELSRS